MDEQPRVPKLLQKPRGQALDWTDDDLDRLSEITPADEMAARALWESSVEPKMRQLLDAEPDPNG